jgi:hypothetical protein
MVIIFGGFGSFSEFARHEARLSALLISHEVPKFDASSFVTTYFPIPLFAVLYFGYKFWTKSKMVDYADMDFVTGSSIEVTEKVRSIYRKISHLMTFERLGEPSEFVAEDFRQDLSYNHWAPPYVIKPNTSFLFTYYDRQSASLNLFYRSCLSHNLTQQLPYGFAPINDKP